MSLSNCSNAYALSLSHTHTFTHTHRLNEIPIYTMNKRKKLLRSLLILIDCACLFMDMHDKGHRLWKGANCFPSILFYFGLTHCTFLDSFLSSPYKLSTNKCDLHTIPFKLTSFSAHPTIWFLWEGNLNEEISTSPFGKTWDFPFFLENEWKGNYCLMLFHKELLSTSWTEALAAAFYPQPLPGFLAWCYLTNIETNISLGLRKWMHFSIGNCHCTIREHLLSVYYVPGMKGHRGEWDNHALCIELSV